MSNNKRVSTDQFATNLPTARTLPFSYVDYSPENMGNAFAIKDAIPVGNPTDGVGVDTVMGRLATIATNTATSNSVETFQNRVKLAVFGEAIPAAFDVVIEIDLQQSAPDNWIMITCESSIGTNPSLGVSASVDGASWNDLFNTTQYEVLFKDYLGNNQGGTQFVMQPGIPLWCNPGIRFLRLTDLGTGQAYSLSVYSTTTPPFADVSQNQVNTLNQITFNSQLRTEPDKLYRVLTPSTGFNLGDIVRLKATSFLTNPGVTAYSTWQNETTKLVSLSPPPIGNLVEINNANDGQQVIRGVASNTGVILVKNTNTLIQSVYVDNLATSVMYLHVFQGRTSVLPINGDVPTESYRIPSNASTSITFDRVYSGFCYIGFSTLAGSLNISSNFKNFIVKYN